MNGITNVDPVDGWSTSTHTYVENRQTYIVIVLFWRIDGDPLCSTVNAKVFIMGRIQQGLAIRDFKNGFNRKDENGILGVLQVLSLLNIKQQKPLLDKKEKYQRQYSISYFQGCPLFKSKDLPQTSPVYLQTDVNNNIMLLLIRLRINITERISPLIQRRRIFNTSFFRIVILRFEFPIFPKQNVIIK